MKLSPVFLPVFVNFSKPKRNLHKILCIKRLTLHILSSSIIIYYTWFSKLHVGAIVFRGVDDMQITIREPGSAITHFIGMMMTIIAATPLMVKAATDAEIGRASCRERV